MEPVYAPKGTAVLKLTFSLLAVTTAWMGGVVHVATSGDVGLLPLFIALLPVLMGPILFRYLRPFVRLGAVHVHAHEFVFAPTEIRYERYQSRRLRRTSVRIPIHQGATPIGYFADWLVFETGGRRHTLPAYFRDGATARTLVVKSGNLLLVPSSSHPTAREMFPRFRGEP